MANCNAPLKKYKIIENLIKIIGIIIRLNFHRTIKILNFYSCWALFFNCKLCRHFYRSTESVLRRWNHRFFKLFLGVCIANIVCIPVSVYVSGRQTGKGRARVGTKCGELVAGWFVVTTRGRLACSGDLFPSCFPANSGNISHIVHSFYIFPHLSLIDLVAFMSDEEGKINIS